jgi:hypothetical protein
LTDLFREIEDDIRRDQLNRLWEKYGIYVVGLAAAILIAASIIVGWNAWQRSRNEAASAAYNALLAKVGTEKSAKVAEEFGKFAESAPSGYAALASLRQAGALVDIGDAKGAIAVYDKLADSSSAPDVLRDMARIKSALLQTDQLSYDDLKARLTSLDNPENAWRNSAREIMGLAAWKAGKYTEAEAYFAAIIGDSEASAGLRDRAHVMEAVIAPHLPAPAAKPAAAKPVQSSNTAPANTADKPKAE